MSTKPTKATAKGRGRAASRLVADKPVVIAAVHPNAGVEAAYRRKLEALIDEMNASLLHWLKASYRANEPRMAADKSPAELINSAMARLARRWQARFDQLAPTLARMFAAQATTRTDAAFQAALRKGGFTVRFEMTPTVRDAYEATLAENVGLIRSIASEHLTDVQGIVMRSVARGRDLGLLAKELETQFGVPKRRAAFISRDQNNKATAVITAARQKELGITQARWVHSQGGKHPRPSHVAASKAGLVYNVSEGALIDGERIWPGQLPNCRCVARSIVPGFS